MATVFIDAGTDDHQRNPSDPFLWQWNSFSGIVLSDAVVHIYGPKSTQFTSGTAGENAILSKDAVLGVNNRLSFYVYFDDFGTGTLQFLDIQDAGPANGIIRLQVTTAGVLQMDVLGQSTDSGSTLSTDTWYRMCLAWSITNATTYSVKLFLNGVEDCAVANTGTLNSAAPDRFVFGWGAYSGNLVGNNRSMHAKHFYLDNNSSVTSPGDIRLTAKLPISAGTQQAFDTQIGSGTNRWDNVSQRPLNEADGWRQAGSSQVGEYYTLQAAAVGDVDISAYTIVARLAWMWAKATAGGSGTPGIMDNGSVTAKTLTASPALYTVLTDSASYPSNTDGIGMRSSGTTDDVFLYECGTVIAYRVSLDNLTTSRRTRSGLGTRTGTRQAH